MDYEFKILLLEKETAYLREVQALTRAHVDIHDTGIAALHQITMRTERNLESISGHLDALTVNIEALSLKVDRLTANMETLVAALLREHPNGH